MTTKTSLLSPFITVNTSTSIFGMSTERLSLGQTIASRRIELGLTQVEVSERVGMSQEWVTKVETGRIGRPRIPSLIALADVLQLDPDDLVMLAGYATGRSGAASLVAESRADDEPAIPPHMRASFLRAGDLSPEKQELLKRMIDTWYEDDQKLLEQMKRDRERREAEGVSE